MRLKEEGRRRKKEEKGKYHYWWHSGRHKQLQKFQERWHHHQMIHKWQQVMHSHFPPNNSLIYPSYVIPFLWYKTLHHYYIIKTIVNIINNHTWVREVVIRHEILRRDIKEFPQSSVISLKSITNLYQIINKKNNNVIIKHTLPMEGPTCWGQDTSLLIKSREGR